MILCQTVLLFGQSNGIFSSDELKEIRRVQIRLFYCDSAKIILEDNLSLCNEQKTALNLKQETYISDSKTLANHNEQLKQSLVISEKEIKRLNRKNRLLKIGIIGVGGLAGVIAIQSFLIK